MKKTRAKEARRRSGSGAQSPPASFVMTWQETPHEPLEQQRGLRFQSDRIVPRPGKEAAEARDAARLRRANDLGHVMYRYRLV